MRRTLAAGVALALLVPVLASAQDRPVRWERRGDPAALPITVFHSTQAANLTTAETLRKGEWLVEISHRFLPPVSDGSEALWGLDGPVFNRLGLSYAVSDRVMLGVVRSNLTDNVELNAKARLLEGGRDGVPFMVGAMGGLAWNTQLPDLPGYDGNERQAYAQLIVNALLGRRMAVGVVPTFLHNPRLEDAASKSTVAMGVNGQLYLSPGVSLMGEWVVSESRPGLEHDAGTFGIELETGGHFFKLVLTNTARMNPTQHLAGTPFAFSADQLRLGFNITRLLAFGG
ncbi:MAG TPA: DUF5777 family beta-barrel protein [Longimicrobiales bacterium]|nr:DUF5777 family beta-barrel protein [Longimicrobiales bacterium]